jgi:hypothetical protein
MESNEKTAGSNLTPIAEYSETAAALGELRQRHQGVVFDVTKPKEMKAAKEARAELRTLRTGLEKKRVEIKAPALERCRLIDAEAKRITAELVALEEPIDVQIKAEEARAESERLAKLEAERLRVEAIQQKIQAIRDVPAGLVGKPSVVIAGQLAKLRETVLDEAELAEHYVTATDALAAAIARVEQLLAAQHEADAEKKRQAERDAEMEAMRKKMAEQQRLIDEAEEAKRVEAARVEQAERDRAMAEERARQAAAQAERDEAARIEREEQERIRAEQAETERIEREAREEAARIEREYEIEQRREAEEKLRIEQERVAELERQAARAKKEAAAKAEADRLANLGLREAAQAVVDHFEGQVKPKCIYDLAAVLDQTAQAVTVNRTKRAARA